MSSKTDNKIKNRLEIPKIEVQPPDGTFGQRRPRAPSFENLHRTAFDTPMKESRKPDDFVKWERANEMIKKSKFQDAIGLLETLGSAQRQQLMLAECYLQLGKMRNAVKCIEKLEEIMTSPPLEPPDEVMHLIDEYISVPSYIRSLVLLSCTSKLYLSFPDQALEGITTCAEKCKNVIVAMSEIDDRHFIIAQDLGVEMINDMLTRLRSVNNPEDKNAKVKMEAKCLNSIALGYNAVRQNEKSLEYFMETKHLLDSVFGSDASKHFEYDALLHNIGLHHEMLEKYSEALEYFMKEKNLLESGCDGDASKQSKYGILLRRIGLIYCSRDEYSEALGYFTKAIGVFQVAEDWDDPDEKWHRLVETSELKHDAEKQSKPKRGVFRGLFNRK